MKNLYTYLVVMILSVLVSCNNVDRLYEKGNYEDVLKRVLKQEQKRKASKSDIQLAEKAFEQIQSDILEQLKIADESNSEDKWVKIYNLTSRLENIQKNIQSASPVRSQNGYEGHFEFIDLNEIKQRAELEASTYFVELGDAQLEIAEKHQDKIAARKAYEYYKKAIDFQSSTIVREKQDKARKIGTIRIATQVGNEYTFGPIGINRNPGYRNYNRIIERMIDIDNNFWIDEVSSPGVNRQDLDWIVWAGIDEIRINTDNGNATQQSYSKQIDIPAVNSNGQPILDSNGNPIMTTQTISATVNSIKRTKRADVSVRMQIIDPETLFSKVERNYYRIEEQEITDCTITGDSRAVPSGVACNRNSSDFDSDDVLINNALNNMSYEVKTDVKHQIDHILNSN